MVNIPDDVYRSAETQAAKSGMSVCAFIAAAVTEKSQRSVASPERPWMRSFGELRHLHKRRSESTRLLKKSLKPLSPRTGSDSRFHCCFGRYGWSRGGDVGFGGRYAGSNPGNRCWRVSVRNLVVPAIGCRSSVGTLISIECIPCAAELVVNAAEAACPKFSTGFRGFRRLRGSFAL
jgi:hypothetical protein